MKPPSGGFFVSAESYIFTPMEYIVGAHIQNMDFSLKPLTVGEYEDCIFENCVFGASKVTNIVFIECEFVNCDLSNTNINLAAFREVQFSGCKMLGLRFETSNEFLFAVSFSDCRLDSSVFYQRKLKKAVFANCSLKGVDFSEADLSGATLKNCDLVGAQFEHTNLSGADLTEAHGFVIDPELNEVLSAKFSIQGLPGLLSRYKIHIE